MPFILYLRYHLRILCLPCAGTPSRIQNTHLSSPWVRVQHSLGRGRDSYACAGAASAGRPGRTRRSGTASGRCGSACATRGDAGRWRRKGTGRT